jgi:hypothetical protein
MAACAWTHLTKQETGRSFSKSPAGLSAWKMLQCGHGWPGEGRSGGPQRERQASGGACVLNQGLPAPVHPGEDKKNRPGLAQSRRTNCRWALHAASPTGRGSSFSGPFWGRNGIETPENKVFFGIWAQTCAPNFVPIKTLFRFFTRFWVCT